MAKLYFHFSTMNAGKSTVLLQASHNYGERGMQTYLLTRFLIDKPREWVEAQYQYLKDMKAVSILQLDSVKLARLEERGEHHLSGLVRIPGVMPTSARPE